MDRNPRCTTELPIARGLRALGFATAWLAFTFLTATASAQAGGVPSGAIPVWCERQNVGTSVSDFSIRPSCFRSDTDMLVSGPSTTVPAGHYFVVTDALVNPESGDGAANDVFFVLIGRDDLIDDPEFELQGTFPDTSQAHFTASQVVIGAGSYLRVQNEGADGRDQVVSVAVSGFLTQDLSFR